MTENVREEMLKDIRDGYIDAWDNLAIDELFETIEKEHEEIQAYRAIGTVEELQALKEKAEPKKPRENDGCTCPKCMTFNEVFAKRRNTVKEDVVYCWHCGQAIKLDWS